MNFQILERIETEDTVNLKQNRATQTAAGAQFQEAN